MPQGNDAQAAVSELADRFGLGDASAEDLVSASRARFNQDARQAMLQPRDDEATGEMDEAEAAKAVDVDADAVTDFAVRGDYVSVRFTDDSGRTLKRYAVLPGSKTERAEKKAAERAEKAAAKSDDADESPKRATSAEEDDESKSSKSRKG
jgi:hypothetical protein